MRRRREFDGAAEALDVRFEEAFGGRTRSASAASFRACWRRRWGRSVFGTGGLAGDSELRGAFAASIELPEDVNAPLLELVRAFSSRAFAEKYPSRKRGVVPVVVLLVFNVPEKFLLAV
jgi:hypothetical protein